jgi:hypothetical protein
VAFGAHGPEFMHADQADQVPSVHVRVCVPQLTQLCVDGPAQVQRLLTQLEPPGQVCPHAPQLLLSLAGLTQAPPQGIVLASLHTAWHTPFPHAA